MNEPKAYLHEFDRGLERIVEPEQQQEVLLHRQQLSQLARQMGERRKRKELMTGSHLVGNFPPHDDKLIICP